MEGRGTRNGAGHLHSLDVVDTLLVQCGGDDGVCGRQMLLRFGCELGDEVCVLEDGSADCYCGCGGIVESPVVVD